MMTKSDGIDKKKESIEIAEWKKQIPYLKIGGKKLYLRSLVAPSDKLIDFGYADDSIDAIFHRRRHAVLSSPIRHKDVDGSAVINRYVFLQTNEITL